MSVSTPATPPGQPEAALPSDPDRLRGRAVWLYYGEGLTQTEAAAALGVSRVAVVRLLAEARRRNEVRITIATPLAELAGLERRLAARFGIARVILAPFADPAGDPAGIIAAAAGSFISAGMRAGMTVGVGWGRTLTRTLRFINGRELSDFRVVSLLGGIAAAGRANPTEFAWAFAQLFQGEGYLIPAPAVVDSVATRRTLLERCGLNAVLDMAAGLDMAILSCGSMARTLTGQHAGHIAEAERRALIAAGAVGDVLYNFMDAEGRVLPHEINARVISAALAHLRQVPERVLLSGGPEKRAALRAAILSLAPTTLITDEQSALALLEG